MWLRSEDTGSPELGSGAQILPLTHALVYAETSSKTTALLFEGKSCDCPLNCRKGRRRSKGRERGRRVERSGRAVVDPMHKRPALLPH